MLTAVHARLIADAPAICRRAGIAQAMLKESATKTCAGTELDYLRRYPHYLRAGKGLCFTGMHTPGVDTKMQAMTAAFLRNFIDARVLTVQALLDAHKETEEFPDPTVLLIPNLSVKTAGKALTAWMTQLLYDLLLSRQSAGKATVVYVEDLDSLKTQFGLLFAQHLDEHYIFAHGK